MANSVTFPEELGGNGQTYTDDADPETGLDGLGYTVRFIPCLQQAVAMGLSAQSNASAAAGFLQQCQGLRQAVAGDRTHVDQQKAAVDEAWDNIRSSYYGPLAEDPSVDPLGDPPEEGDRYYNTVEGVEKSYNGSSWHANEVSAHLADPDPHSQYEFRVMHNTTATRAPNATDDSAAGYDPRSTWFDTSLTPPEAYRCIDATEGAAKWVKTSLTLDELGSAALANTTDFDAAGSAQAVLGQAQQKISESMTAHEEEADPHEQYFNKERGDARYLVAGRNLLNNAKFRINQREYVSGSPTGTIAVNKFTLDRWYVDVNGEAVTFVASGSGNQVTAPAGGMSQVVEGADIEGGEYTLSWIGDATAEVNAVPVNNGGQLTLPTNTNAKVSFMGGTVEEAQLEKGSIATPFEHRPMGWELALCKRFYEEGSVYVYVSTSSRLGGSGQFSVAKRAQPAMSYTDSSGVFSSQGLETLESFNGLSSFRYATPSGLAANVYVGSFSWAADAEIII